MRIQWRQGFVTALILLSFLLNSLPIQAQIVTSEDISGGSSVFVFRKSIKPPQAKFAPKAKPKRDQADKVVTRKAVKEQAKVVAQPRKKVEAPTPKPKVAGKPAPKPIPGKPTPKPEPVGAPTTMSIEEASNQTGAGAEVYLDRGETDKAIKLFRESLKLNPKNELAKGGLSEAFTRKADATFETEGAQYAVQYYEEALNYNPKNSVALAGMGSAYEQMNDDKKAFEYYEKAVAVNPGLTELYSPLGIGYYERGEIEKADELLTKAVAAKGDDYETQYLVGLINYKKNRDAAAEKAFKKTVELKKDLAEAYYFLGEIYDRNNREDEAFEQYNKAVQVKPNYPEAWFDLGVAYYNHGRLPEAADAYSKSVQYNNANWEAHANLADVYRQLAFNIVPKSKQDEAKKKELYAQAEGSYRIATDLAENNAKAKEDRVGMADLYSNYGFILGRSAKWNGAIAALEKAIAYNPDAFDYSNIGWAYYNAAQIDKKNQQPDSAKGKLEKGRIALEKAVAIDSKSKAAYMNLGITQTDLGDFNAAIDSMKKCLSLSEDWYLALNELGIAYKGAGNLNEAVKSFARASDVAERAISNAKNDLDRFVSTQNVSSSLYNLAFTHKENGNDKEAKKAQDRLRKYNPNMANALEAIWLSNVKGKVNQKINENNPLNKIKIPRIPY